MTREKIIEILRADRNTETEIEKRLKNNTFEIYDESEKDYLMELYDLETDAQLEGGDFSKVELDGNIYYIAYQN